mgnify:CR=1
MDTALRSLVSLLDRCQRDTLEVLGVGAAGRLANWQRYADDRDRLVRFIRERLLVSRQNGYKLEQNGKLSLERIVAHHHPGLFTSEDIEVARATLEGKV